MQVLSERITALITVIQSYPPTPPYPRPPQLHPHSSPISLPFSWISKRRLQKRYLRVSVATRDPSEGEEPVWAPEVGFVRERTAEYPEWLLISVYILRAERLLGAFDEKHLGVIRRDIWDGGGAGGRSCTCSQCPLFLLPPPLSRPVRMNATGRTRSVAVRQAVSGGLDHRAQVQPVRERREGAAEKAMGKARPHLVTIATPSVERHIVQIHSLF